MMHFIKSILLIAALVASVVVAFPANLGCGNTGNLQCCNNLQSSRSVSIIDLFDLLNETPTLAGSTGQVGFSCSPIISDTGLGGAMTCTKAPACCSNIRFNGVLAVGCIPMNTPPTETP
ncbi:hypothetical protein HGRIS_013659 [Hohenbuehelia grisea]|uniref:Hydrophobin n=1 Tax=Hohenbuehelia grisea TaxID=104357 RepID=A0ABR3IW23_9AGAR